MRYGAWLCVVTLCSLTVHGLPVNDANHGLTTRGNDANSDRHRQHDFAMADTPHRRTQANWRPWDQAAQSTVRLDRRLLMRSPLHHSALQQFGELVQTSVSSSSTSSTTTHEDKEFLLWAAGGALGAVTMSLVGLCFWCSWKKITAAWRAFIGFWVTIAKGIAECFMAIGSCISGACVGTKESCSNTCEWLQTKISECFEDDDSY